MFKDDEISDFDLDILELLAQDATQGPRCVGVGVFSSNEEGAQACAQVFRNRPDGTKGYAVFVEGTDLMVAMTMNGPTSFANAQFIAACNPDVIAALITRLRTAESLLNMVVVTNAG